jgi:cytochrome c peroxidase
MRIISYALFVFTVALFTSCKQDQIVIDHALDHKLIETLNITSTTGDYTSYVMPSSSDYSQIMQEPKNPLNPVKVQLGKFLFHETGHGREAMKEAGLNTFSCTTCHVPERSFVPGRVQGIADGGIGFGKSGEARTIHPDYQESELDVQGARPLFTLNLQYVTNTSWAGKFGVGFNNEGLEHLFDKDIDAELNKLGMLGLETQNISGLRVHRMVINKEIVTELGYKGFFDMAFPEFPEEERYTQLTGSLALSAYLRTVMTQEAPFQKWLRGDHNAMTEQQKRGALLFFSKGKCYTCHEGPALNANEFYAVGVKDLYETGEAFFTGENDFRNFGRGDFTGREEDMFKFKVPQLYNLKDAAFYFHGSSKRSLREVVEYFNKGVPENPRVPSANIAPQFHPLYLSEQEVNDLTEFLEHGLFDPNLQRYTPMELPSGNCFPNGDQLSKVDMGCL